jgi:hypothetical protein
MPGSTAVPTLLTDPGYLFVAPLLSTEPANTVAGSIFTDAWPAAWISAGATKEGSNFTYGSKVEPISVAEFFDPIKYSTTERSGSMAFAMASVTPISGTGATALAKFEPVTPGAEVRVMLGWESTDGTTRIVIRQAIQGGDMSMEFQKAPATAYLPVTFNFEVPAALAVFSVYSAGATRLGS